MEALLKLIPIFAFLVGLYKTYYDVFSKREISDFEQMKKYFCGEKTESLKKEPEYTKDMFCQTISFLKGHKYKDISYLLENKNLNLFDLKDILRLKKMNLLIIDEKNGKLILNREYDKQHTHSIKQLFKTSTWFSWTILFIYVVILIIIFSLIDKKISFGFQICLMLILVGVVEIPVLNHIDKIKSAEKFKKNKLNDFINQSEFIFNEK
ncbi:hypothetical protein [Kingella kingae]|uniref:hypothetical protein n=1 Tax=Kingella kingae TaxID=504 RepID=UPI00254F1DF6|nr:hypothetical protein [Kingella kingae]MDK4574386.1 hypothetical protein [Kingella kingae]MDK4606505.1 hypothetical protein [Kingella kingae]